MSAVLLLLVSNTFMTSAWYGHLKRRDGHACGVLVELADRAGETASRWNYAVASLLILAAAGFAFYDKL